MYVQVSAGFQSERLEANRRLRPLRMRTGLENGPFALRTILRQYFLRRNQLQQKLDTLDREFLRVLHEAISVAARDNKQLLHTEVLELYKGSDCFTLKEL